MTTGRIVAAALMVAGIALPGVVTATFASWLIGGLGPRPPAAVQEPAWLCRNRKLSRANLCNHPRSIDRGRTVNDSLVPFAAAAYHAVNPAHRTSRAVRWERG